MADDLLAALAALFPPDRLLTRPAEVTPYESDGLTTYRVRPAAVVLAETQQEVVETVRLCYRFQVPFVARGSGTSLSGGALPIEHGVVIALNRLNRVIHLDAKDRLAVVEPGVINLDISRAAAPYGLYYAPDPSSQPICTIGGNLAYNSGGAHCLKYGMTSNHVLGIKAVLPDGEVVYLGGDAANRFNTVSSQEPSAPHNTHGQLTSAAASRAGHKLPPSLPECRSPRRRRTSSKTRNAAVQTICANAASRAWLASTSWTGIVTRINNPASAQSR